MILSFEGTVAALCDSIVEARCGCASAALEPRWPQVTRFVLEQHARMPDYLRTPLRIFTLLFDLMGLLHGWRLFRGQPHESRWRQIESWRRSFFSPARDLIRFYESLIVYYWYTEYDG